MFLWLCLLGLILLDCGSFILLCHSCIFQLHIAAVQVVVISALLCRDEIHILQTMHIIRREEAVADAGRITVHPALVIATEQTIHIELREVGVLLLFQQQILDDALLDADKPRGQGMHHEVQ